MKAGLFIILAVLALGLSACAKQEVVIQQENVTPTETAAGNEAAVQIESTFEQSFDESSSSADDISPDDLVY